MLIRALRSFQRSIDHGQYVIQLHAWKALAFRGSFSKKLASDFCGTSPARMSTRPSVKRLSGGRKIREAWPRTSERSEHLARRNGFGNPVYRKNELGLRVRSRFYLLGCFKVEKEV
jgi:hypothetical protein